MRKSKVIWLMVLGFFGAVMLFWNFLPAVPVFLPGKVIFVPAARSAAQRSAGLQLRSSLGADEGMLFCFEEEGFPRFWMKDTYVALDIAFIDKNKRIVDIQRMLPLRMDEHHVPARKVKYALEMNAGWFAAHDIGIGQQLFFW